MKGRFFLIFAVIVLLPSVAVIWLSFKLNSMEDRNLQDQFRAILNQRLVEQENSCTKIIDKCEKGLVPLLKSLNSSEASLQDALASSDYIKHIFALNAEREVIFPTGELTAREEDFIVRTSHIWRPENFSNDESFSWHTWYSYRKLNYLLWVKTAQNEIIGIELRPEKILEDVVDSLPAADELGNELLILASPEKELFRSGVYEIADSEAPQAELAFRAPLQSWRLKLYSPPTALQSNLRHYSLVVGGILLALTLAALCAYFYRENTRQSREALQRVNFANQVSHELKTPLTNIRMYAELLEGRLDEEDSKSQRQLGVIVFESQRLSRMINNVLSFARHDKNKLTLNIADVAIDSLLQQTLEHFGPSLKKKSISYDISGAAPALVKADADAIEQIIGNLISNVEKYVPAGASLVVSSNQDEASTSITVTDTGPGIPTAQAEKIFSAFHRLSNQLSDGVAGTGIGLTISRELAALHGGSLELEPAKKGARFTLKIPNRGPKHECNYCRR